MIGADFGCGSDTSIVMCYISGKDGSIIPMDKIVSIEESTDTDCQYAHAEGYDTLARDLHPQISRDNQFSFTVKTRMKKKDSIRFQRSVGVFKLKRKIRRMKRDKEKYRRELLKYGDAHH